MADIIGTKSAELLLGTTLQDLIIGQGGDDIIDGRESDDVIFAGSGNDMVLGSSGDDYISGGTGDDTLDGGNGNDVVLGGEGDDTVRASFGDDSYEGGKGFDTIDFRPSTQGVTVDLSKGTAGGLGVTTVQGFERIIGTSFADDIKGSNDADVIEAGSGRNVIRGAGGADDLSGGFNRDTFVWKSTDVLDASGQHRGVDTIRGFETNDTLDIRSLLKGTVYGNLDEVVHLTETDAGTMLQVKQGASFVDVALLADTYFGAPSATAWANDGILLA